MAELLFDNIYDEFHEKLGRYLERMVGKNDAEDLAQEVFLKIRNGIEGFKGESSVSTWVYRIATNAALDRLRSRAHREECETAHLGDVGQEGEVGNIPIGEEGLSAEREAIRNEMTECIREFVERLPEDYKTVITLSEMKDLKNQEIADILDVSLDTVKIRLHRARVRLKAEFEAGCDFYQDEEGNIACDRKQSEKNCE